MALSLPRGTRDYSPSETIVLKNIIATIEDVFKRFGFYPIQTPSIELMDTLNAKAYGDEPTKEIYTMEGEEEGLRYDFTVPLARYVAMNKDIPMPFKRYQIGEIWRRDEPQHMRSREVIQADIDIVGSPELISDVEVVAATALAIERIGISNYTILISSRIVLDYILSLFSIPKDKHSGVIRVIDKLGKLERSGVLSMLKKAGMDARRADELLNFIEQKDDNTEILGKLGSNIPEAKTEIERLERMLGLLQQYHLNGKISIDISLARGLDYYTSTIWEFVVFKDGRRLPTIAAGGRYDNLIGLYSKKTPAVGSSIGIGRIFELISGEGILETYAKVHVSYIKDENLEYALFVANAMRAAGIYVDFDLTKRNLSKQLEYTNSMSIRYTAIIGNQERTAGAVKLRDMLSGDEETLSIEAAIAKLTS